MVNENKFADLALSLISISTTNEMFRGKSNIKKWKLEELADSIKEKGVITPILVTPDLQNDGRFVLIAGERRYRASLIAGQETIPSYIREMTPEQAFDAQMIENLQREDIHPLREAKGYSYMMEQNQTLTTAEIAARVGKSESYVIQRLKLNDLVHAAKQDFMHDRMTLGHALILAKLTPELQRECIEEHKHNDSYGTVAELQDYVNRNIMKNLTAAPFDKKDPELYKKAGACVTCPKRSGCSPLLFSDIKEQDRCMDSTCFWIKFQNHLIHKTKEIVETQPDVVFLRAYNEPIDQVQEILTEHKIKSLKEYDDFNTHDKGQKVKGFWISGRDQGKFATIYLKKADKEIDNATNNQKVLIQKIQQRTERGRELDGEKVYAKILNSLREHPSQKKDFNNKMMAPEDTFLWFIVYDRAGFQLKQEFDKLLKVKNDKPETLYDILTELTPELKATMVRKVMMDQYGGLYPNSDHAFIIRKIAEAYKDVPIEQFETEQAEIRTKREERAKEKIKAIKAEHRKEVTKE
jgi:ParB/RepB/Spo0J family partition protein